MRKIFTALLLLSLLVFPKSSFGDSVPGDVIVVLRNTSGVSISSAGGGIKSFSSVQSLAKSSNASIKAAYDSLSEQSGNIFMLLHSDTKSENDLLRELKERPDVVAASLNHKLHINDAGKTPNDPQYWKLWGMEAINAPYAWNFSTGSSDVYVAVIDTGIDTEHEDLRENFAPQYSRNFVSSDTSAYNDENDHGTHISGTIAAVGNNNKGVAGVNWKAKIIALRTFDAKGRGEDAHIIAALNYVASLLRNNPSLNLAALNMSLGGYLPNSPDVASSETNPLWLALKAISDTNRTVICVAAGNESHELGSPNDDGEYCYPASFMGIDNMIVAAALQPDFSRADYSNYSSNYADIAAPGSSIFSSISGTKSIDLKIDKVASVYSYGEESGTSMATSHVSGAAALMKAIYPSATARQIKSAIVGGSDGRYLRNDGTSMYGMLDLKGAIDFMAASISGDNAPKISDARAHDGIAGQPYILSFYASGAQPVTWSIEGNLPYGLSFDSGKISGTAAKAVSSSVIVTAENNYGTDSLVLDISIKSGDSPVISTEQDDIPDAIKNVPYGYTFELSAGSWPVSWDITSDDFPDSFGVELNRSIGKISLTPKETGTYTFTLRASNYAGSNSATFTVKVGQSEEPKIVSYDLRQKAIRGISYGLNSTFDIAMATAGYKEAGGTVTAECALPFSWDVTGLPEGMSFDYSRSDTAMYSSRLRVFGTPEVSGSFDIVITVRDSFGSDSMDFSLSVEDVPCSFTDKIRISEFERGIYGYKYYVAMGSPVISFDVSGDIPSGTSLVYGRNTAMLAGVPTETGRFRLVITASNDLGADSTDITIMVNEPVEITGTILPDGLKGTSYDYTFSTLYNIPVSWDLSGDIPGLSLNASTGRLSGNPSTSGTFKFSVKATASGGRFYNSRYSLTVKEAPSITTTSLPDGRQNSLYTTTALSADGSAPITWSVSGGSMPRGLMLASNGYIHGTPAESGPFAFTLRATNAASHDEKAFSLLISADSSAGNSNTPSTSGGTSSDSQSTSSQSTTSQSTPGQSTPGTTTEPSNTGSTATTETARITQGNARSLSSLTVGELSRLTENNGMIGAILPEIRVSLSGLYSYESVDAFSNIRISPDVPAGYILVWNAFSRDITGGAFIEAETEENSATFYDNGGRTISEVPDNHTVNVSAWLSSGRTYAPVISAVPASGNNPSNPSSGDVASGDVETLGSSGGGCNFGGIWLALIPVLFLAAMKPGFFRAILAAYLVLAAASTTFAAEYVEGQALVVIKAPESIEITEESVNSPEVKAYLSEIASSADGRISAVYGALSAADGQRILVFIVSDTAATPELIDCLKRNPRVISASPNYKTHI